MGAGIVRATAVQPQGSEERHARHTVTQDPYRTVPASGWSEGVPVNYTGKHRKGGTMNSREARMYWTEGNTILVLTDETSPEPFFPGNALAALIQTGYERSRNGK